MSSLAQGDARRSNPVRRDAPVRIESWDRWRNLQAAVMTVPALLVMGLFFVIPAFWAIYASFTDRSMSPDVNIIGFDNYRFIWNNPDFLKFVWNTVVFVVGSALIGQTGLGLTLAFLIDHATKRGYVLSYLAYAAVLVAWIAPPTFAGNVWGEVFEYRNGLLNNLLGEFGVGRIDMLGDHPMLAVIIADVWRGTAFAMVIFLGALRTIPGQIYEAAQVDGASNWRMFTDHTLPLLRQHVAIVMIMTTLATIGSFLLILILTNGSLGYETETLALFAYHRAFVQFEIGYGAAISVIMLAINLGFAAVYLKLARVEAS
jgi:multiple sugar transport system permease protein